MIRKDISLEGWRCYEWIIPETGEIREHLIRCPISLYYEKGSSYHVVTSKDSNGDVVAHCVPSVGLLGCVLTWGRSDGKDPVLFVSASK